MIRTMRPKSETKQGSTLAEVAHAAGVSIATASRVLNGENKELWAGPAARAEKIRQAAKKLGYRPDWRARALRSGRTNAIGVVYSEVYPLMDVTSYGVLFREFGAVLQPAGYHMVFVHVPRTAGAVPASILQAVDAAVFYHNITEGEIEAARILRGPSILINCERKLPYPSVSPDDVSGATALARHLLELGHRRIAFSERTVAGAEWNHFSRIVRERTIRQVMKEAGVGEGFVLWDVDLDAPRSELPRRFASTPAPERPTALIVSYGLEAITVMNDFLRQGIKVPQDLSIATFDDHALIEQAMVPLTTVAVPMDEMGRTAAGLILGRLQNPKQRSSQAIVLPERLVVRQSTGPAPR